MILEINLYTDGADMFRKGEAVSNKANNAVSDLIDFMLYLESEATQDFLSDKGIAMEVMTPPNDVSQLINDVHFRYRAMTELTVYFPIKANGAFGISEDVSIPNSSGGGSADMVIDIHPIEDVEIEATDELSE